MTLILLGLILRSVVAAQGTDPEELEKRLVGQVKRTPVSSFGVHSTQTVEQWITSVLGRRVTWELNDCGEGGDGHVAPACVEIASDDPHLFVWITVLDTEGHPVAPGPELFAASVQLPTADRHFKRLTELPELVRAARRRRR